ncbi:MAG: helix-turn-helix transcriptional regulator [Clostridium sp.]
MLSTKANGKINDWRLNISVKNDFINYINDENNFKILLIHKGNGLITINGTTSGFISPSLFIFNNEDKVSFKSLEGIYGECIFFHPNSINSKLNFINITNRIGELTQTDIQDIALFTPFIKKINHRQIPSDTSVNLLNMFNNLKDQLINQPDSYWPCRARSYLLEVLIFIDRQFSSSLLINTSLLSLKSNEGDEILLYLYNNIQNKISINDISRSLGINKNIIQKRMYNVTGESAMSYLQKLRMHLASLLLRDTGIPISEIALRCGFVEIASFGRAFKKNTGFTPSDFRNYNSKSTCS